VAKPDDGFQQPPAHVAGHGLPVEQPGAAVRVARLLKQAAGTHETALCPGEVSGRQVDDRCGCEGLAQGVRPAPGLGDRKLGQFLAAVHAGGSGLEDGQLGQDTGAAPRIAGVLQRSFQIGAGFGEHAAAAVRFGARLEQHRAGRGGRLQG
jgi:hypothetical protein